MSVIHGFFRYSTWPLLFLGMSTWVIWLAAAGAGLLPLFGVLGIAIIFAFIAELAAPYQQQWNRSYQDQLRDWIHALINLTVNRLLLWSLPLFAWMGIAGSFWPETWPFWAQVIFAVLILDFGIALAHHASHRINALWSLHAVHHSVKRLYSFNGLMKHPLHQLIETLTGVFPLLLLGIPMEVALTLPFLVSLSLLAQHSNVDYKLGPLKYIFAHAETHRYHHTNDREGNYNYGLFTHLYDHLVGSFHYEGKPPKTSAELGISNRDNYPTGYFAQLKQPFVDILENSRTSDPQKHRS